MIGGGGGVTLQRVARKGLPEQDLNDEKKVGMHLGIPGRENGNFRGPEVQINVACCGGRKKESELRCEQGPDHLGPCRPG